MTDKERTSPKFKIGDRVRKISGSSWQGHVCGTYSTGLTPEGYVVKSEREVNSVQAYPAAALEGAPEDATISIERQLEEARKENAELRSKVYRYFQYAEECNLRIGVLVRGEDGHFWITNAPLVDRPRGGSRA